jgi:hypothetical protein
MSTQVAISQEQQIEWKTAIQEFANETYAKYPGLDSINNSWINTLVDEVRALGLDKSHISLRSLRACFRNCVGDNRIKLPDAEPVLTPEVIQKIRNSFPPVVKRVERELTQREKNSLSGVEKQSARLSGNERKTATLKVDNIYDAARNNARINKLRQEYRDLKLQCETLRGENARSHAQAYAARREALQKLNEDPKYREVRES